MKSVVFGTPVRLKPQVSDATAAHGMGVAISDLNPGNAAGMMPSSVWLGGRR